MATVHSCEPNLHLVCGISGCSRNYTNFFSFKKHVHRKHQEFLDTVLPPPHITPIVYSGSISDLTQETESDDDQFLAPPIDEKMSAAQFMLKSRALYQTTEAHLSSILDDLSGLLDQKLEYTKQKALGIVNKFSTSNQAQSEMTCHFYEPFAGFETRYLQDKYFVDKVGLVVSYIPTDCVLSLLNLSVVTYT